MARQSYFLRDKNGSVMPVFGLVIMAISALVGVTIAIGMDGRAATSVQTTADSSALAGATAFISHPSSKASLRLVEAERVAKLTAQSNSKFIIADMGVKPYTEDAYGQHTRIDVSLAFEPANIFAKVQGRSGNVEIRRHAAAKATSGFPLCMLALAETESSISVSGASVLEAENCTIWSNSKHQRSLNFENGTVNAQAICTAGLYRKGMYAKLLTTPEVNCDPIPDPMADWTPPSLGACTKTKMEHIWEPPGTQARIRPGVYCGGMLVDATDALFEPGIYEFRGPLIMNSAGDIVADEVGFLFTANGSYLSIGGNSRFAMRAPTDGPMRGIAIAEDRSTGVSKVDIEAVIDGYFASGDLFDDGAEDEYDRAFFEEHYLDGYASTEIGAAGSLDLEGVIYLPSQHVRFTGAGAGRQVSPLLQVVAQRLTFQEGSALKIDFDPSSAKVPVVIAPKKTAVLID